MPTSQEDEVALETARHALNVARVVTEACFNDRLSATRALVGIAKVLASDDRVHRTVIARVMADAARELDADALNAGGLQ